MQTEIINTKFLNLFNDGEFVVSTLNEFFDKKQKYEANPYIPHRLTFFAIVFFIDGNGFHHIDFTNFRYQEMSLFFICKGQLHAFEEKENANGYILYFTDEFVNRNLEAFSDKLYYQMFNCGFNSPQLCISDDDDLHKDIIALFEIMYREYQRSDYILKEEIIRCLLKTTLHCGERMKAKDDAFLANHKSHALFIRLQNLVEENIFESRNSQFYCEKLNVGYRKLNTVCKEFTGMTMRKFIDDRLVLEIKRLLSNCDYSIKEICYKTGFDEPTNMTKFFRCNTGMLPKAFRASLQLESVNPPTKKTH
ncbi:helix-turn-helix domain-containing protein [Pseudomonadota bacterium]